MITIVQSIRPKWTKEIFSLKKRIELRKDKPATDEPFRVLIYETKGGITKESRHLPFPQHEGRQEEERNRPSRNYFNLLKWRNRK